MEITEVRVKLTEDTSDDKLQAFCSITIDDDFVIRDLKIIGGAKGPFVAMPSRKLADRCQKCGGKNHLRARFCNQCGGKLKPDRAERDEKGRPKLHADVAHPINSVCRERIQSLVLVEFQSEVERSKLHGYRPPSLDDYLTEDFDYDFQFLQNNAPESESDSLSGRAGKRSDSRGESSASQDETKGTTPEVDDDEFGAGIH